MKKWFLLTAAVCFFLLFTATASASNAKTELRLSSDSLQQTVGKPFEVTVWADHTVHLSGISFELRYDPAKLQLVTGTNDQPLITKAPKFQSFGAETIDLEGGVISYPLLYEDPLRATPSNIPVMTLSFVPLEKGPLAIELSGIQVTNYVSQEVQLNSEAAMSMWIGEALEVPPGETKFSIKSALYYVRQSGGQVADFNGDGAADKSDMIYVLDQIEPMLLNP